MPTVLLPHSKRTQYEGLRYAYPEAYKTLLHTLDNTPDMVNTHLPPLRPKTMASMSDEATAGQDPSADELLAMSQEALLQHLSKKASKGLSGLKKERHELQKSRSQPHLGQSATAGGFRSAAKTDGSAKGKPRLTGPQEQEILRVARDRNACGSLLQWGARKGPTWEKVGFLGERSIVAFKEKPRTPLPDSVKAEMAAEKESQHQLHMKVGKCRLEDGRWCED
eukprot:TRINITY_DN22869_c0_g1_i2.p1 TRINITY_DN22869_c0_g1~~TRINITY_DN22869_c0_g1_i2.p1  ORF type:complete len:223 (-),score=44.40 TRINITY_DN22869_c0_g1_i2:59-727(-)